MASDAPGGGHRRRAIPAARSSTARTGLLVPPGDPTALAAALDSLLHRAGCAARWGPGPRGRVESRVRARRAPTDHFVTALERGVCLTAGPSPTCSRVPAPVGALHHQRDPPRRAGSACRCACSSLKPADESASSHPVVDRIRAPCRLPARRPTSPRRRGAARLAPREPRRLPAGAARAWPRRHPLRPRPRGRGRRRRRRCAPATGWLAAHALPQGVPAGGRARATGCSRTGRHATCTRTSRTARRPSPGWPR